MKNFKIQYLTAIVISYIGNALHFIAITWLVYQLSGSITKIGILLGICFIPKIISSIFCGKLVDKYCKSRIAYIADFFRFAINLVIPIYYYIFSQEASFTLIIILEMSNGLLSPFFTISSNAMAKEYVGNKHLLLLNRQRELCKQISFVFAAIASGIIVNVFSPYFAILLNSFSFFLSFLLFYRIKKLNIHLTKVLETSKNKVRVLHDSIVSILKKDIKIPLIIITIMLILLPTLAFDTFIIDIIKDRLNGGSTMYGFFDAANATGAIIASTFGRLFRILSNNRSAIYFLVITLSASCLTLATSNFFLTLMISCTVIGFIGVQLKVYFTTWMQKTAPLSMVGRVQATLEFSINFISLIAYIAFGTLSGIAGVTYILVAISLIIIVIVTPTLILINAKPSVPSTMKLNKTK